MTSRMPEISVSLSRTSGMREIEVLRADEEDVVGLAFPDGLSSRETSSIRPRVCLNCSFSLNSAMTFLRRGWNG